MSGHGEPTAHPGADRRLSEIAALTGTSIDNATDWTNLAKRNWTDYIASRRSDG